MTTTMTTPLTRTRWSSDDETDRFVVDNPAYGTPLAVVQGANPVQVDAAVRAAHDGFLSWSRRTPRERGTVLMAAAQTIREHADELAALESSEVGKPFTQARGLDLEGAIATFEFFAGLTGELPGNGRDSLPTVDITMLHPFGVIAGIIPFNWPPAHAASKTAPALAVGNAVVLKPPEQAPLSIMRMVELLQEVLPDDVLHVVPGGGAVGAALAGHPLVRKVSFTGAPTTGASVIKSAADNLTPTVMELGGKNPLVVFEDADLDAALAGAIEGGFFNQGEACTAASRVLVHESIYVEFAARLGTAISKLRVGDGADAATHVGPLVTRAQQQRVLDYIAIGTKEGATIAAQAALPDDPALADGFYVAPTLFTDVTPQMRIAKEEIFGPVAVVIAFRDEAEAIEIANNTDFGLVATVFTRDSERSLRVGRAIEAGIVFVNGFSRNIFGIPFGGTKHSGYGRETAAETLREFGYAQTLRLRTGIGTIPRWFAVDDVLSDSAPTSVRNRDTFTLLG
jgi:betaine-aldehyde dehydrogenase